MVLRKNVVGILAECGFLKSIIRLCIKIKLILNDQNEVYSICINGEEEWINKKFLLNK